MDRRRFLSLFGVGVAGLALEQAIPLGRVWSFPKEIVVAQSLGTMLQIRIPQRFTVRDYLREHDQLTEILKVGDVFAIASVNKINPPPRIVSVETITGKYSLPKFTAVSRPDSSRKPS